MGGWRDGTRSLPSEEPAAASFSSPCLPCSSSSFPTVASLSSSSRLSAESGAVFAACPGFWAWELIQVAALPRDWAGGRLRTILKLVSWTNLMYDFFVCGAPRNDFRHYTQPLKRGKYSSPKCMWAVLISRIVKLVQQMYHLSSARKTQSYKKSFWNPRMCYIARKWVCRFY